MQRTILHVSMDAFFASVEQKLHPEYAGKPVIVGELSAPGATVSSVSDEARACGIVPGMPMWRARQRCPEGIFLPVNMPTYTAEARKLLGICERFSPCVEPFDVGEAFLDVTGSLRMFGGAEAIARQIQAAVAEELQLVASVGIAPSKLVAKMVSGGNGPHGLTIVEPGELPGVLDELPVSAIWVVGREVHERLRRMGVRTVGELRRIPFFALEREFGGAGRRLYNAARGVDHEPVRAQDAVEPAERVRAPKAVGQELTLARDTADVEPLRLSLLALSEQVATRLRSDGCTGRRVTLRLKFGDSQTISRTTTLPDYTNLEDVIYRAAAAMLERTPLHKRARAIGVSVGDLRHGAAPAQMSLFDGGAAPRTQLSEAKDRLRTRYGHAAVTRASLLQFKCTGL